MLARFRVEGREAELWHPDTGEIVPAGYTIADGRTTVPLHLEPRESVFVVFRRPAALPSRTPAPRTTTTLTTLSGPWDVVFPPNLGAPEKIRLIHLESWTANPDEGVKYFSGTATYTKTIQVPQEWLKPGSRITLDLGTVKDMAEVSINGRRAALLWKPPYRADISGFLKAGTNRLEINVTNQWTNRQTGDRELGPEKRILAPLPDWMARFAPREILAESGLIGPVTVVSIKAQSKETP